MPRLGLAALLALVLALVLALALVFSTGFAVGVAPTVTSAEEPLERPSYRELTVLPGPTADSLTSGSGSDEASATLASSGMLATQSVPEGAVMSGAKWWNVATQSWDPLQGNSHSEFLQPQYSLQRYSFEIVSGGYLKILLSSNPAGYWFYLERDGAYTFSTACENHEELIFRALEPGEYRLNVRSSQSFSDEPYMLTFESPNFTYRTLKVTVGGSSLLRFDVAFTPPTVLSAEGSNLLRTSDGEFEFYAADSVYSVGVTSGDYSSGPVLLFGDSVDFSISTPTELAFGAEQLNTLSLIPKDGLGSPDPGVVYIGLGFVRNGCQSHYLLTPSYDVKTNAELLLLDYYHLYGVRSDPDRVWTFGAGTTIEAKENPSIALGGPLTVSLTVKSAFVSSRVPVYPDFLCTTGDGHRLESVYLYTEGRGYVSCAPHYSLVDQSGSVIAQVGCPMGRGFQLPSSIASGPHTLLVEWDSGGYAGILTSATTLTVDNGYPQMTDPEVSPSVVSPLDRPTVSAKAQDDLSGIDYLRVFFNSVSRRVYASIYEFLRVDLSYESALDRYTGQVSVPDDAEMGQWELVLAQVRDLAGNQTDYFASHFPNVGFEVAAPSVTLSPSEILLGDTTEVTVTVTLGGGPLGEAQVVLDGLEAVYTGADGTAQFAVTPSSVGAVPVRVWTKGGYGPVDALLWVSTGVTGDLDGDYLRDPRDMAALIGALGKRSGGPSWDPSYDIVPDGVVDIRDLVRLGRMLGAAD